MLANIDVERAIAGEPDVVTAHPLPYASPHPPKARAIWRELNWLRFAGLVVAVNGAGFILSGDQLLGVIGMLLVAIGMIAVLVTLFA